MKSIALRCAPWLTAMALFFIVFYFLIKLLPGVQMVEIDMEIDHPDHLRVFHSLVRMFHEGAAAAPQPIPEQRDKIRVLLNGGFASYLRLDTGVQPGITKMYEMRVHSYFHAPLVLGPQEIGARFVASPDAKLTVRGDHVEILSTSSDPYIFSKARLFPKMPVVAGTVALGFALLVLIICRKHLIPQGQTFHLSGQTAKRSFIPGNMAGEEAATTAPPERFEALDGLRGLAAMMVIADHTWGWFRGLGASGVWIFFALSGFLLARPFIDQPRLVLSLSYMAGYLRRRFMRILPMYYAYLFVVYLLSGRLNLALAHGLFLQGDGHLWAIPQEICFYLLWPLAVFLLVLPLARWAAVVPIVLLAAIVVWNRYVDIGSIWLLGMDHRRLPLFFGVFLSGVFFSFGYSRLMAVINRSGRALVMLGRVGALVVPLILIFFLLFSTGHLLGQKMVLSQRFFGFYGFLAGLLVFAVVVARNTLTHRCLILAPLRELGKVGLSLYLVHPLVKSIIDNFSTMYLGWKVKNLSLFLATLALSYLLARYTFRHIEQPGFLERSPSGAPGGTATR
jgi:peptidoglycan/LPS O-acetylase OafA/YrhL